MDKVNKSTRSFIMSQIKGKDTKPEQIVFQALESLGVIFEKHYKLLGNPDIAFPSERVAIFIDGDFWHGKDFARRKDSLPKYWVDKIQRNMRRDKKYIRELKRDGWITLRVWEHDILKDTSKVVGKILSHTNFK